MSVRGITPNEPANFTPTLGTLKELQPFRFWCQKVLPLVYDDSLSYYELLCKVVDYLNKTMEDVKTLEGDVTNLREAYEQLQDYVNNYFTNLDLQKEINKWLDNALKDGTLSKIFANVYNVALFGITPENEDNSVLLNELLKTTDIKTLFFPAGVYTFKHYIKIPKSVKICGEGETSVLSYTGIQESLETVVYNGNSYEYKECFLNTVPPNGSYMTNVEFSDICIRSGSVGAIDFTLCINFSANNINVISNTEPLYYCLLSKYGWNANIEKCWLNGNVTIRNSNAYKIHECIGNTSYSIYDSVYGEIINTNTDNGKYIAFYFNNCELASITNCGCETYYTALKTENSKVNCVNCSIEVHSSSNIASSRETITAGTNSTVEMIGCVLYFRNFDTASEPYFENISVLGTLILNNCDYSSFIATKPNIYVSSSGRLVTNYADISPSNYCIKGIRMNEVDVKFLTNFSGTIKYYNPDNNVGEAEFIIYTHNNNFYSHITTDQVYNTDNINIPQSLTLINGIINANGTIFLNLYYDNKSGSLIDLSKLK